MTTPITASQFSDWLTPEECAAYMRVEVKLVYRWVDQHLVPCTRIPNGAIRIPRDKLADASMLWLEQEPADVSEPTHIAAARAKIRSAR